MPCGGGLLAWSRLALGDPLAFIATQAEWNRRFSWPWETVVYAWNEAARQSFSFQVESQSWTYLATLVLFGVLASPAGGCCAGRTASI